VEGKAHVGRKSTWAFPTGNCPTGPYYPIKASLSVFCDLLLRFSVPNTATVEEANELFPHEYDQPFNQVQ